MIFKRRRKSAYDRLNEPFVNVVKIGPYGFRITRDFPSLAAAKATRLPGERTVRRNLALARMAEKARDPKHWAALTERDTQARKALEENAFLHASHAGSTQPVEALADMPEEAWDLLSRARLALAGLGHVRPRRTRRGYSTTEIEVTMTWHEVELLALVRGVKLSVPAGTVNA